MDFYLKIGSNYNEHYNQNHPETILIMCGIYGIVSSDKIGDIKTRCDLLTHRGPDDAGIWVNTNRTVGLAHRRLSIIDLSGQSHQPFISADKSCVIIFNGEIYNYHELRHELQKDGYKFCSTGDTEVILTAYLKWGSSCITRLNGMFAFAIYDMRNISRRGQIFFARDRAGKKPFYYSHTGQDFEFASELKAIQTDNEFDPQALNHYLALGYVPFDLCITKGVKKLPAAHAGSFDLASGDIKTWRYWTVPKNNPILGVTCEDLAEESWELLKNSVKLRLRSDVPTGVFLSGGLDSSLITAAAVEVSGQPVSTFTIGVPGSELDESRHANLVADYFSTKQHLLAMPEASLDVLDELTPFVDEPLADSSILPTFLVSKLTAAHVKVALGGDGGDELYGGYTHYQTPLHDIKKFGWLPKWLICLVATGAGKLPAGVHGRNRIASLRGGLSYSHLWGSPYFDINLRKRILNPDIIQELGDDYDLPERNLLKLMQEGTDQIDAYTRTDFNSVLPDDYLVKVDRASMANSLEVRSPFLDFRLIEHAFGQIPSSCKVKPAERRCIQNIMAQRYLPKNFTLHRKQGFSIPMDEWLRKEDLKDRYNLEECDLLNKNEVKKLINGHNNGRANGARLFALIMLKISLQNTFS